MLRLFLFLWSLSFFQSAMAQDAELKVVASAGAGFTTNELMLDWTLGEPIVSTLKNSSSILSQGFHQPQYSLVSVRPLSEDLGSVTVFPNPFISELTVNASFTEYMSGHFELYDTEGRQIWSNPFEGKNILETLPFTSLSSNAYLFVIRISDSSVIQSYKLLKTQ